MNKPQVGIVMGSDSDLKVMQESVKVLEEFGIPYEITVNSAHRTPDRALEYAKTARERGLKVIIASAGGAAHLAGVMAANTTLPVIGVPLSWMLGGIDAFLATAQMPPGVPVAAMAIDGGKNAGLFAAEILGASDEAVANKLASYKEKMAKTVKAKSDKLQAQGYEKYLKGNG